MRYVFLLCAVAVAALLAGCIEEYSDSIVLNADGSAVFEASIYPCDADTNKISEIKRNYDSAAGMKLDSVWFSKKDSLYAVNFRIVFENLLNWKDTAFDKDFIGSLNLSKIDSVAGGFSFARVMNPNSETEDGSVVPEEGLDSFTAEQLAGGDSMFWKYSLTLPKGATLLNSEPIDTASISSANGITTVNWKIPASVVATKRTVLRADFSMPQKAFGLGSAHWSSLVAIGASCLIMLLAIAALVRRLGKLGAALKALKEKEGAGRPQDK